jgi:hypothetical protein
MQIPQTQGPYASIGLYVKQRRRWYFGFDVFDDTSNTAMNLALYDAFRMNISDPTGTAIITLSSDAGQITAVNTSSLLINASPEVMNVRAGYYQGDLDGQVNGSWEPFFTVNLRIDHDNG